MARETMMNQNAQAYLEMTLSGDEDPGLQTNQMYQNSPGQSYNVPPGIQNLQQWGELKAPSGKHQGKSFNQIYGEDRAYLNQIRHRRAVSAWLRSLQNYLYAREKYETKYQIPVPPMVSHYVTPPNQPKGKAQPKGAAAPMMAPKMTSKVGQTEDWQLISGKETPKKETVKRSSESIQSTSSALMPTEPNPERVRALQTQIAVLQRELARETQVPSEEVENPPLN